VRYLQEGVINAYGYTYLGEETDGYTLEGSSANLDPPYKPLFGSAHAQLAYDKGKVSAGVGLRYEYFAPRFRDYNKVSTGGEWYDWIEWDYALGVIDEAKIEESNAFSLVLPRAHLRVTVGETGKIYLAFGSYASMPPLDRLYMSNLEFSRIISPVDRTPYTLTGEGVAFEVKPERSTHYELGTRLKISRSVFLSGSVYYKALKDQLQISQYCNSAGDPLFASYQSTGYGTIKGIELGLDLLRTEGLALSVNYAFSDANGLTSNPLSNIYEVATVSPVEIFDSPGPYDYDKRHVAAAVIDYRLGEETGEVFQDLSFTAVVTRQSGHPYTQENQPTPGTGIATPWTIGVWSLIDPTMYSPLEPRNSSRTPAITNLDLKIAKGFRIGSVHAEAYFAMLNVLNTKHVLNVYPTTGNASTDGWLGSDRVPPELNVPLYDEFYQAINLNNRWAYMGATGNDIYGSPRQFRIGLTMHFGVSP
jgi:outer membrane receptor protein involved in Fe transport